MNAKYSLSMSRLALLLAGAVLCALPLRAQEPWREGQNIAGLAFYDSTYVQARVGGGFTSGGYRLPSEASQLWTAGAGAQAERHFRDMVFTGSFSFELQHGKDMMGSMFTQPGYYPIDVLEFTPGPKTRQTYQVGGGLAWLNGSRWIPGFTLNFQGINYSKRKDLRHTTYRQEISFVPSLLYKGEGWNAGLSAILEKNSEFIQAEQIGTATAESYYAFLDKGHRYGTYQVWDGSGIHLSDVGVDRMAVNQFAWGVALQASLGQTLYADAQYKHSNGLLGEKGYTWFRFQGHELMAKLIWNFQASGGLHRLRADVAWEQKDNHESVIDRVTEGGVTTPVEYGNNRIYVRRILNAGPSYAFESSSGWGVGAAAGLEVGRHRGTQMYPFLAYDASTLLNLSVDGHLPLGPVTLEAGLSYRQELAEEHSLVDTDPAQEGVSSTPFRLQDWWEMEEEYYDASRLGMRLNLRYDFTIGLFLEAGCEWMHIFHAELLPGLNRQTTHLTIGYRF